MNGEQTLAWYLDKLNSFFGKYRYLFLLVGTLGYFLTLTVGSIHFFYGIASIVFGAFSGIHVLVSRHYLVNLQDENPVPLLYPMPLYFFYSYLLITGNETTSAISFCLWITGVGLLNIVDIFWRDVVASR